MCQKFCFCPSDALVAEWNEYLKDTSSKEFIIEQWSMGNFLYHPMPITTQSDNQGAV